MKATRFMRQPFIVTGYQVTEDNMDQIATWCEGHVIRDTERPFVRVPVNRPTNQKQTQAFVGTWVLLSSTGGADSFKVYTTEWLGKSFIKIPREIDDLPPVDDPSPAPKVDDIPVTEDINSAHNHVGCTVRTLPVQGGAKAPVQFRSAT